MELERVGAAIVACVTAWLLSLGLARLTSSLARTSRKIPRLVPRLGLMDRPGDRKPQLHPVPLVGGIALLLAIAIGAYPALLLGAFRRMGAAGNAALTLADHEARLAILPIGGFLIGLLDDALGKRMSAAIKAIATLVLIVVAVPWRDPWFATVAWWGTAFVAMHSANTIDHANGVAGGIAVVSSLALVAAAATGFEESGPWTPIVAAATAGAAAGFLFLNFPRARVYLGDSGTLLLGGLFAALLLEWRRPELLLLAAVPLADLASVSWLRVRAGAKPWIGDRRHVTHRLMANGMSETRAVLVVAAAQAACSAAAAIALARNLSSATGWSLAGGVIGALALGMLCVRSKQGLETS